MAIKQKTIFVTIEGNKHEVKFPNVGQLIDIENMKMALTNGQYAEMVKSGLRLHYQILNLVDTISIFSILISELKADLSVRDYTQLDPFLGKKLVSAYKKDVKVWFDDLLEELMKDDDIPEPLAPTKKGKKSDEEIEEGGKSIDLG